LRPKLSESLEDYLETIHQLIRDQKTARVKEIAEARGVRMASVTNAMRRLSKLGLIQYNRREFIQLTPDGVRIGQRTKSRHLMLYRFFSEILRTPDHVAENDSCAVEHYLSDESFDGLVRLFEYMALCPEEGKRFIEGYPDKTPENLLKNSWKPLSILTPGAIARVVHIKASGPIRQRLIDLGILPDTRVEVVSIPSENQSMEIRVNGFLWTLSLEEAAVVFVSQ